MALQMESWVEILERLRSVFIEPTLTLRGDTRQLVLLCTRVPDALSHQVVQSSLIFFLNKTDYVGLPALKVLSHINEGDFNPCLVVLWLSVGLPGYTYPMLLRHSIVLVYRT